jgi:hypothetical protein
MSCSNYYKSFLNKYAARTLYFMREDQYGRWIGVPAGQTGRPGISETRYTKNASRLSSNMFSFFFCLESTYEALVCAVLYSS